MANYNRNHIVRIGLWVGFSIKVEYLEFGVFELFSDI